MGSVRGVNRGKYKSQRPGIVACSRCDKVYKRAQSLLQHIWSKHQNNRKTCAICARQYTSRSVYNRHLKNVHGVMSKSTCTLQPIVQNNLHQLSFEKDEAFPCMAKILSLKQSKKFGKHIVTTPDIDVGQFVIATRPFASVDYLVCTSTGCFECGKASQVKFRCPHCINVWFCSHFCKRSRSHKAKCDPSFERSDCRITRLSTRIITVACNTVDDIVTLLEFSRGLLFWNKKSKKCHPPYSQYGEVLTLRRNPEFSNASIARRVLKYVMQIPQLQSLSMNTEEVKRILFNLAYRHANTITLNAFEEETICSKGGVCMQFSIHDIFSRLNHSCNPNIDNYVDSDDVTYCVATRPIKAGEQLFINYLYGMKFESTEQRKKYLMETWHFDCKCELCYTRTCK